MGLVNHIPGVPGNESQNQFYYSWPIHYLRAFCMNLALEFEVALQRQEHLSTSAPNYRFNLSNIANVSQLPLAMKCYVPQV